MPQTKIQKDATQIMIHTDQDLAVDSLNLITFLKVLNGVRSAVPSYTDIDVHIIGPGSTFEVHIQMDAARHYYKTWHFDNPVTEVSWHLLPVGKFTRPELVSFADLRDAFRKLHQVVGIGKFTVKY